MPTTDWSTLPTDTLSVEVRGNGHGVNGPLHLQPQWIPGAGATMVEGPIITESPALDALHTAASTDPVSTPGLWRFTYDNNYDVRWHPAWSANFSTEGLLEFVAFPLIDPDADAWRIAKTMELQDAWEAAHPDHYAVRVEWEWDGVSIFGAHSDRSVEIFAGITQQTSGRYIQVDFPGGSINPQPGSEDVIPPLNVPPTRLVVPPGQATTPGTYTGTETAYSSPIALQRWSYDEALAGALLGSFGAAEGYAGPGETVIVPVSDAVFDAAAVELTRQGQPWRRTRGAVTWALPDIDGLWNTRMASRFEMSGSMTLRTVFQPPRYRVTYDVDSKPVTPYRRVYPRDDGLGSGGAPRTFPPSKAQQSSNRTFGGYL